MLQVSIRFSILVILWSSPLIPIKHDHLILKITLNARVLQYTGIFSDFQHLVHTGINNDGTGISCVLKIT